MASKGPRSKLDHESRAKRKKVNPALNFDSMYKHSRSKNYQTFNVKIRPMSMLALNLMLSSV
ncbi:hypothetical protein HanPSC8_Chr13g0592221 [Helianthus annuus]|nr:hypothetical protein HanPSC8_Chr13g0592221 [Helianthus annuus]